MTQNLSQIFDELYDDLEMSFSMGDWFLLKNEDILKRSNNRSFSHKAGAHPVILIDADFDSDGLKDFRPLRLVYPRSTTDYPHPNRIHHKSHQDSSCNITKDGWVCMQIPCTVKRALLTMKTYSCDEPEDSELMNIIRVRHS